MLLCGKQNFIQDDTYISLQYAKNLFMGNGLVFNIGESVEGFTSILWVLILSIPYYLNVDPEVFAKVLSISFGVLCLLVTYFITITAIRKTLHNFNSKSYLFFIPVILLAISGTFYYWSVSGMEALFYTFLCLVSLYFYLRRDEKPIFLYSAMGFVALAFLTRQEAVLIVFIFLANLLLEQLQKNNYRINFQTIFSRELLFPFFIFFIPFVGFLSFRLYYFGYLFPNTFYAKTGMSSDYLEMGIQYTISFFRGYLLYGTMLILPLILLAKKEFRKIVLLLYAIISNYIIYVILVGGDVLTMHRFYIPILPIVFILFSIFLIYIYQKEPIVFKSKLFRNAFILLLVIFTSMNIYMNNHSTSMKMSRREKGLTNSMKSIGLSIKNEGKIKDVKLSIAASTIGALKYFSECRVLDMLGLTDKFIAHNPSPINVISDYNTGWKEKNYNADYVLSQKPDYIVFSTGEKPSSLAERALFTKIDFHKNYFVYPIFIDSTEMPKNVYKRHPDEKVVLRNQLKQENTNYSPSFIHLYNAFLNQFSRGGYLNKFEKVEKMFDDLIKVSPSYFDEPYRFMALLYYYRRDNLKAIEYAGKCIQVDSSNIYSRVILYRIGQTEGNEELTLEQEKYFRNNFPEIYNKHKFMNDIGL